MEIELVSDETGEVLDRFEIDDQTAQILETLAEQKNMTKEEVLLLALKTYIEVYSDK